MKELAARQGGKRGNWGGRKAKVKATRRPTMIDVANEAKVSQTTVSLVLNKADAARLGYKLGWSGGSLGGARNSMIAFVCDEISTDPWTAIEFDGVREKAWE